MLINSLLEYIANNPVTTISYVITGATFLSHALKRSLKHAKWDNKFFRFMQEVSDHVALDSNARYIKVTFEDEKDD